MLSIIRKAFIEVDLTISNETFYSFEIARALFREFMDFSDFFSQLFEISVLLLTQKAPKLMLLRDVYRG